MNVPNCPFRVGFGYDVHRFAANRKLILGGIEIPHEWGLEGHSDADCLSHAIADAMLGAAGLPDIGHYFPDTDPQIEGIDSHEILKRIHLEVQSAGFDLVNVDSTVIAEVPKIAPYRQAMVEKCARTLGLDTCRIALKATTHEGLGSLGRKEGIAAYAVCLIAQTT